MWFFIFTYLGFDATYVKNNHIASQSKFTFGKIGMRNPTTTTTSPSWLMIHDGWWTIEHITHTQWHVAQPTTFTSHVACVFLKSKIYANSIVKTMRRFFIVLHKLEKQRKTIPPLKICLLYTLQFMDSHAGFLNKLWSFISFLPFFFLLLILGIIKGSFFFTWICMVFFLLIFLISLYFLFHFLEVHVYGWMHSKCTY